MKKEYKRPEILVCEVRSEEGTATDPSKFALNDALQGTINSVDISKVINY